MMEERSEGLLSEQVSEHGSLYARARRSPVLTEWWEGGDCLLSCERRDFGDMHFAEVHKWLGAERAKVKVRPSI